MIAESMYKACMKNTEEYALSGNQEFFGYMNDEDKVGCKIKVF